MGALGVSLRVLMSRVLAVGSPYCVESRKPESGRGRTYFFRITCNSRNGYEQRFNYFSHTIYAWANCIRSQDQTRRGDYSCERGLKLCR